jgi:hypothetical protein
LANLELLEKDNWDLRWNRIKIPDEVTKDAQSTTTKELIKIFDKTLPKKEGIKILEIGAAQEDGLYILKNILIMIFMQSITLILDVGKCRKTLIA